MTIVSNKTDNIGDYYGAAMTCFEYAHAHDKIR